MRKALLFLGILNDDDVDWMISAGSKQMVPSGTVLIREGSRIESVFIVVDGAFEVTAAALQGRTLAKLRSGEILGEMSFVDSRPPSASVTAVENSCVLNISRKRLTEKIGQDVYFASRLYRSIAVFLSDRLRSTVGLLGYSQNQRLSEEQLYSDEIDPDVLENMELAGARFDWIQKRLRSL